MTTCRIIMEKSDRLSRNVGDITMLIQRISAMTGKLNTRNVPIKDARDLQSWRNGELIQNALSYLSADDREFIMTGVTPEEWAQYIEEAHEELSEPSSEY